MGPGFRRGDYPTGGSVAGLVAAFMLGMVAADERGLDVAPLGHRKRPFREHPLEDEAVRPELARLVELGLGRSARALDHHPPDLRDLGGRDRLAGAQAAGRVAERLRRLLAERLEPRR